MSTFTLPNSLPLWDLNGAPADLDFKGKIIGLYFSASWCGPCRKFTPKLSSKLKELKAAGHSIEIILVSADQTEEEAKEYHTHSELLYMLDYNATALKEEIDSELGIEGIPTLVLFDGDTSELITSEGCEAIMTLSFDKLRSFGEEKKKAEAEKAAKREQIDFAAAFPDGSLHDKAGVTFPASALAGADVVGLYFSAHWCPPCRGFTPVLAAKYEALKAAGKKLEIIFVSSDRSADDCSSYFADMPWTCLKYENRETKSMLSELYDVQGIPTLVLISGSGKLITTDGREAIIESDFDKLPQFAEEKAKAEAIKAAELKEAREFFSIDKVFPEGSFVGAGGAQVTTEAIAKGTVLLYFGAGADEDCVEYVPRLKEAYAKWKAAAQSQTFEVVYVSCDRSQEAADASFAEMGPWAMLKFEHRDKFRFLLELLKLRTIPTLVAIKDGTVKIVESFDACEELLATPPSVFRAPK